MRIIVFKFCKNIADYEFRLPWMLLCFEKKNFQYNLALIYFNHQIQVILKKLNSTSKLSLNLGSNLEIRMYNAFGTSRGWNIVKFSPCERF